MNCPILKARENKKGIRSPLLKAITIVSPQHQAEVLLTLTTRGGQLRIIRYDGFDRVQHFNRRRSIACEDRLVISLRNGIKPALLHTRAAEETGEGRQLFSPSCRHLLGQT